MVPPWANQPTAPVPPVGATPNQPIEGQLPADQPQQQPQVQLIAPANRFGGARASARSFGESGGQQSLGRSLGQHISRGYGGSATYSRRMGHVSASAGSIYNALDAIRGSRPFAPGIDAPSLSSRPIDEACAILVDAACQNDGTMDSDLARTAFYDAISDFISADDDFTWSTISDPDIAIILESFISECIFQRAYIDLHVNIRNGCTSIAQEASRISEVRDFIKAEAGALVFNAAIKYHSNSESYQGGYPGNRKRF